MKYILVTFLSYNSSVFTRNRTNSGEYALTLVGYIPSFSRKAWMPRYISYVVILMEFFVPVPTLPGQVSYIEEENIA